MKDEVIKFRNKFRNLVDYICNSDISIQQKYKVFKNSIILSLGYYTKSVHISEKYYLVSFAYDDRQDSPLYLFIGDERDFTELKSDVLPIRNGIIFCLVLTYNSYTGYNAYINKKGRVTSVLSTKRLLPIFDVQDFYVRDEGFDYLYSLSHGVFSDFLSQESYNSLVDNIIEYGVRNWDDDTIDFPLLFEYHWRYTVEHYTCDALDMKGIFKALGYNVDGIYSNRAWIITKVPHISVIRQDICTLRGCIKDFSTFSRVLVIYSDFASSGCYLRDILTTSELALLNSSDCFIKVFVFTKSKILFVTDTDKRRQVTWNLCTLKGYIDFNDVNWNNIRNSIRGSKQAFSYFDVFSLGSVEERWMGLSSDCLFQDSLWHTEHTTWVDGVLSDIGDVDK